MRRLAFLVLLFLVTPAAHALKCGDSSVVIPVISRLPGAYGTEWRTDLFVRNVYWSEVTGTLTFYVVGGSPRQVPFTLAANETRTYRDVVRTTFGLDSAWGQLHITTPGGTILEARARLFNAGNPNGEFGQGIEGIGRTRLQRQAVMFGLDGTSGNRVNIGLVNPNDAGLTVNMQVSDRNHDHLHWQAITLAPYETLQLSDIFARFGIPPQDNVIVEFNAELAIYGYASEVRNDTGDAVFSFGTGPNAP